MKKILAVILSALMTFSVFAFGASAKAQEEQLTKYPVILVPGYTSTALYSLDENGNKVMAWGDMMGIIAADSGIHSVELVTELLKSIKEEDASYFAKRVAKGFNSAFRTLDCNSDGTSVVPLYPYISGAADTNYANLREKYPEGDYQAENEMMTVFGEKIGFENLFVFTCDFRMGAIEISDQLRAYIDEVIEYTNSSRAQKDKIDKVNLFAVSHGGQISGTYLSRYGHEGKVNNAVLTVPALGGAGIAYDLLNSSTQFDTVELIKFLEHGMMFEEDYHYLADRIDLKAGDSVVSTFFPAALDTIKYWGSMWDFLSVDKYEEMKAKLLDPVEDAEFIRKSDKMHYEVMSPDGKDYFAKGFKRAQDAGANIYIMAGYNALLFTGGLKESSDALITIEASTGATAAPLGKRFSDGYTQKVDTGIYQVSPSMTVDASTSYLPYHTWFVENYYHGMTCKDEYTFSLLKKLLLTDGTRFDVRTLAEFPQFHATTNPSHGVFAQFNNSKEGFLSKEDTALTVKNLSDNHSVIITKVVAKGVEIDFSAKPLVLNAGESKEIPFEAKLPEESLKNFEVTVSYLTDTVSVIGERTFDFTLMNGKNVNFDSANPYTDADFVDRFHSDFAPEIIEKLDENSIGDISAIVYNMFYDVFAIAIKAIEFVTGLLSK